MLPRGTVMLMSISALSVGWSLAGNHHGAMWGSSIVTTSCSSACHLLSSRYCSSPGTPAYVTFALNLVPTAIGCFGVMRSSCAVSCEYVACPVLRRTRETGSRKSSENFVSRFVAVMVRVVRPVSRPESKR